MIAAEIAIVKTVCDTFAPIIIDASDAHLIDPADDFGPADDDAQWDAWADEAACLDMMEAGLGTW